MEGGFPKVTAKYPEIQQDVRKADYTDRIIFQVGTIFDGELYLNQYQATREMIEHWDNNSIIQINLDNTPNVINAHSHVFIRLEVRLKEAIEKKKSARVQLMVDQIANAKWN